MKVLNGTLQHIKVMSYLMGLGLFSIPALANNACDNANTQMELNECTAIYLEREDRFLNKSYKQLRTFLNHSEKQQLKQAQLAWIGFRDKSCEFSSREFKGGSAYSMVYNSCLTNYTKSRRIELDKEINSFE